MNKSVKMIVGKVLPEFGFSKQKANNWYKTLPEVVHVVGLQKSSWGDYYHINLAVWVKELGGNVAPKFHQCHMMERLEGIALHGNDHAAALNEEDYWKMDAEERHRVIRLELANAQFAFFRKLETIDAIKKFLDDPKEDKHVAVTRVLIEFLNAQPNRDGSAKND